MKICITGAAGFIGMATAKKLIAAGHEVIGVDDYSATIYDAQTKPDWLHFNTIDRSLQANPSLESLVKQVDAVVHFAAVAKTDGTPTEIYRTNVEGTVHLLDCMAKHGVKYLIAASSAAVYGSHSRGPALISEPSALPPDVKGLTPYGQSKKIMECLIGSYARTYDMRALCYRFFNVIGAGERRIHETHILPNLLRAARTGEPFNLHGGAEDTVRDYVNVDDCADAVTMGLERLRYYDEYLYRNLNICTGYGRTTRQLIDCVEMVTGRTVNIVYTEARSYKDPSFLVGSAVAAHAYMGWKWRTQFTDSVRQAWEWEKQRGH